MKKRVLEEKVSVPHGYRHHKHNNKKGMRNPAITYYKEIFTILKYHKNKNNIPPLQDHQHLLFFLNVSYITPSHCTSYLKISRTSMSFKCILTHPKTYMNVVPHLSSQSCQRYVTELFITDSSPFFLDSILVCMHGTDSSSKYASTHHQHIIH